MALKYNGYSLQSANIITENVQFRSMAQRVANLANINRRTGAKYLSSDYGAKTITMTGRILAPTASGMVGIIDELHNQLSMPERELELIDNRTITATPVRVEVPEQSYSQTIVPFTIEFLSADPRAKGSNVVAGFNIPIGTITQSIFTTISGSANAEPKIVLSPTGVAGATSFNTVDINHVDTGDTVTISGTFSQGVDIEFDYRYSQVTVSGAVHNYTGAMSDWDAGSNTITITVSGSNTDGVTGSLQYTPRYYQ